MFNIIFKDAMGKSISRLGSTMCGIGVVYINENKYIFHKQIGEGAFSYVDLIEDLKDGTNYALKRIICHDKKVSLMDIHFPFIKITSYDRGRFDNQKLSLRSKERKIINFNQ